MKYLGLHPDSYEYCMCDTLEALAEEFDRDHDIAGLKGVEVYRVPDTGQKVKLGYTLIENPAEAFMVD